jgi:hypothetical protein
MGLFEAARSSKRDPDGTEAGGLERSLSVTGNFGAGSGSGALMKRSRFAADSMLEESGFEPSVPSIGAQFWDLHSSSKPLCKLTRWSD